MSLSLEIYLKRIWLALSGADDPTVMGLSAEEYAERINNIIQAAVGNGGSGGEEEFGEYVATLSQSGTDAPVATVLKNTLNTTLTWSRNDAGEYSVTAAANVFIENRTIAYSMPLAVAIYAVERLSETEILLSTHVFNVATFTLMDGFLFETMFVIRVYE